MNIIDVLLLIIITVFCIKGVIRGMILEVLTLVGLLTAYIFSIKFMNIGSAWLSEIIKLPPLLANTISFLVIFILIVLLFRWLAIFIRQFMKWTLLGWIDKGGGLIIGLFKGTLIASLVALLISLIPFSENFGRVKDRSLLFRPVSAVAPAIFNFVKITFPKTKSFYDEVSEGFSNASKNMMEDMMVKKVEALKKGVDVESIQDAVEEHVRKK